MEINNITIRQISTDLIYNYLNNPSIYSKEYIQENFNSAIIILSKNLESYFQQNSSIKQYKLGDKSVTYADRNMNILIEEVKALLPTACKRKGIVYC